MDLSRDRVQRCFSIGLGFANSLSPTSLQPQSSSSLPSRAAVAIILCYRRATPAVLLMKRASHNHDRWSGQISLPGGKALNRHENDLHTAVRETYEEVGLNLQNSARCIGAMNATQAMAKGKFLPMLIHPFVFIQLGKTPLRLGREADSAFWLPLDQAAAGQFNDSYEYTDAQARSILLPCWSYRGRTIWGLTYNMLMQFLHLVRETKTS